MKWTHALAGFQLTPAAQRTADPKIFREGSRGFVSAEPVAKALSIQ